MQKEFIMDLSYPTSADRATASVGLAPLPASRRQSIGIDEVVRTALTSMLANKLRSLLTMLGIIIGVASVIALLALGEGVRSEITKQVSDLGASIVWVT